jgi:predicted DsbA family dithiol-disulfide isomerase
VVLRRIADAVGMDGEAIGRLLETDADLQDLRDRDAHARMRGVQGVPCFIVANKYAVNGAQPTEFWEEAIAELAEQTQQSET